MKRKTRGCAILAAALSVAPGTALSAEADSLKEQVVGTWKLVSLVVNQGDRKVNLFGDNARGIQIMTPDGRFANIITRESLPLYAGAKRMKGTAEEYTAIGQGSNALYGTYEVDEAEGIVTFNVEVSTFPNWEGETQRRKSVIDGDTWRYTNPMTAIGPGNVEVVWTRMEPARPAD
ncbi:MAG: lipocalin-like domain-containing protein [Rhizobiaceae bacterium]|nr:lipocalin-like domain-containing protein [Rhizobiaceae bacterium]MCV0408696.1 lipocalin-like domain-containing protein [Rhizobiaceae bacterium]